ncbi:VWA domain-containing protein [Oceanobacillus arenosus]|uniref:VWA domain-containing protein n=1 Tax=Oceanobacillus arenosus TaxID=1229153 RepID=A0A3D8PZ19_9BACI|nr:VWA domain-containing protein [Oceanobacillus arenosus]RDW20005.1 VWA domain-containing protein [Oceanobacillus arenosus]
MKKSILLLLLSLFFTLLLASCSGTKETFTILSGSENEPLEPMLTNYAKKSGYQLNMIYKGSVDSMLELRKNPNSYDGIWLPNSMWISMGDTEHVVKHDKSMFTSPVVFGIRQSKAEALGFTNNDVLVEDILHAVENKDLTFMMTSASQSNSGASAYIGFLYALLGNPNMITKEDLQNPTLKEDIRKLFSGINRSSGSSGWLKDLYLKGDYDAMVNYEAVIIEANQELMEQGKEPLFVIYPQDGLTIADNTLGYIDNGEADKEAFFLSLQDFLLSEDSQANIEDLGRRTGLGGLVENPNDTIFNPDWGIETDTPLASISFPAEDVIYEALTLYQTDFKKPSYTVFALDYSGSMSGTGEEEMEEAIRILLNQEEAKQYLLQSSDEDKIVIIPFNDQVLAHWEASNLSEYDNLYQTVESFDAGGGTDIYQPVIYGLEILKDVDTNRYNPAVILMTDGESEGDLGELEAYYHDLNKDIPVFSITFGDASDDQLLEISELTRGRTFDGKDDLIQAFKSAKGYN